MGRKNSTGHYRKPRWGETQKTYIIVAIIAAVIGIYVHKFAVNHFSDEVDYSDAPRVTSESGMDEFRSYTGKMIVQGTMTGETYTFYEKYDDTQMAERPDVDGSFLYSRLVLRRPVKYVKNQKEVDKENARPEYGYRDADYVYEKQAEGLNVYGLPLDMEKFVFSGLMDYGELYDAKDEKAKLKVIEGPEASIVILGEMENGAFVNGNFYLNGTIKQAIDEAAGGLIIFDILLAVWLVICGIVIFSMYLQRYDKI